MIQRIQTIYLLLACVSAIIQVILTSCHTNCMTFGILEYVYMGVVAQTGLCLAISIFLFGNRKRQMKIVSCLTDEFLVLSLVGIGVASQQPLSCYIFCSTTIFPLIAAIFSYLSWRAIRSDERKVRAADRIR